MINILFAGNEGVFDGILTGILSILMRTDTREAFCFYIYTMDLTRMAPQYTPVTEKQTDFLCEVVQQYDPRNQVVRVDVTHLYEQQMGHGPNETAYCSPYTLLRLFADEIEGMPDKLLYLDADILFQRDVTLLYETDIEEYEYAAARDHYGKYLISPNYINAGVLLFNMKKVRQTGLLLKARSLLMKKKLPFADQSAIYRSTACRKMLPQRFNDQKFLHPHTVVRHFSKRLFYLPYPHTANIKQWQVNEVHRVFRYIEFDDILVEYLSLKKKMMSESGEITHE